MTERRRKAEVCKALGRHKDGQNLRCVQAHGGAEKKQGCTISLKSGKAETVWPRMVGGRLKDRQAGKMRERKGGERTNKREGDGFEVKRWE